MRRLLTDYGMVLVLVLLCVVFSVLTNAEQHLAGPAAAPSVAAEIQSRCGPRPKVLVICTTAAEDQAFGEAVRQEVAARDGTVLEIVVGEPSDAVKVLRRLEVEPAPPSGKRLDAIACQSTVASWRALSNVKGRFPNLGDVPIVVPGSYSWPNFLKSSNLLNVANQIVVIAIVAIGMTMVIITGGIDLSVGSLIALSAVVATLVIRDRFHGLGANPLQMTMACLAAVGLCGLMGLITGAMVTVFKIPSFIVTLAMMLVASGRAYQITSGQSVSEVPDTFVWLGRGADFLGIPNAVLLMLVLYVAAHVLMSQTMLGRYLYAVGGNAEAARLSGVPVTGVLLFAYFASGALAGLGGVVMASQLKSGSPTYGQMYELYVIAAVVVGGTSLSGGEGKIFGTLIGALIIGVIQNGMNLTGIESYTQKVVLGGVILAAVLLDRLKHSQFLAATWMRWTRSTTKP